MRITFITNYMTPHQRPFCEAMYALMKDDFHFIATTIMENERKDMGWSSDIKDLPYASFYDDDYDVSEGYVMECDALICGGTHSMYISKRLDAGKLTFRYYERLYKKGRMQAYLSGSFFKNKKEHCAVKNAPVYLLCAGAYVASDFNLIGAYKGKMLRYGYFPEFIKKDPAQLMESRNNDVPEILWSGRQLDWKHPGAAVFVAEHLRERGIPFHMTIVGDGECRENIGLAVEEKHLEDCVTLKGFEKSADIRARMDSADIYLMTSDMQEGWGAVVNEAMNAGCAVIASHEAGSVPYLIEHGVNGLVYRSGNLQELSLYAAKLCNNKRLRRNLGMAAYETIRSEWNAETAAKRFVELCERFCSEGMSDGRMLSDIEGMEKTGPLSIAPVIKTSEGYDHVRRPV